MWFDWSTKGFRTQASGVMGAGAGVLISTCVSKEVNSYQLNRYLCSIDLQTPYFCGKLTGQFKCAL